MVLKKQTIQTHTRICVCVYDEIASWRRLEHYAVEYRWMQLLFIIALCWFSFVSNLFFFAVIMVWLLLKLKCFQINSFICSYTRTAAEKKTSVEYNRKTSRYYVSKLQLQWYCCCAMDCYFGVRECECVLMILSSVNFVFLCAN